MDDCCTKWLDWFLLSQRCTEDVEESVGNDDNWVEVEVEVEFEFEFEFKFEFKFEVEVVGGNEKEEEKDIV